MPFHNPAAKLVLLVVVHSALIVWGAPPGPVPSATAVAAAQVEPADQSLANSAVSADGTSAAKSPVSDLLDERKLPFLSVCDADKPSVKLCDAYRSLVTTELVHRKSSNPTVTVEELEKVIVEKLDANRFCDDFVPVLKNRKAKHPEMVAGSLPDSEVACNRWCVMMDQDLTTAVNIKAVCRVLLWGYRQELAQEAAPQDAIQQVASKVVVPPLLDQNVQLVEVEKKEAIEPKPAAAPVVPQPNITEQGKAAAQPPTAPKVSEPEQKAQPFPDTAGAIQPPSEAIAGGIEAQVTPSKAASTVSDTQQKPEQTDKVTPEDPTSQEQQNQDNLNAALDNNEGDAGNSPDDGEELDPDSDDEYFEQPNAPQKSLKDDALQQPAQGLPHDTDSDGLGGVDQPAAAEVKIEKVDPFFDPDDSNFFSYFIFMMFACIACYVAYHNKSKLLALVVEGRRSSSGRGGFSKAGGRKHTAAYRKLDCNLEEAITSNASSSSRSTSQFIY